MMIESMAGKSAAVHGLCHDATPFTFSEEIPAVNHFGQMLLKGVEENGVNTLVMMIPNLFLQLATITMVTRGCTVAWMGGN